MSIFTLCLRSLFIGTFLLVAQTALATIEVIGTTPTSLNDCDGTITLIAVGSAGPFKVIALGSVYHVQENVDGEYTIPDLCAGAYTIKVFNRFGCEKTINATIEKITCPTITLEDIEDAITHPTTCGGSDGEIYFRFGGPTGGTEPYSWLWSNGSTNSRLSFVTSGTYTLTITDAVGCTGVFDFTLTGQDEPEIVFEDIAPACEGDNNGQIVVFASQEGGGAVNFQWSAGDVIFQDNVSSRVGNLPPGTHTVTITNTNMNCSIVRNYEVTDISASIPLSVNAIKSNTCPENASGSIQLQITGGVPNPDFVENNNPYNVVWAHGVVSNTQLNNLSAGNYCVTVTDFCGAMVSQCFDLIVDPNKIFDVILTSSQNATGTDLNDGEITVEAIPGNTGDFTYQWSNGATGQTISNLSVGNYSVTVTNNLTGCSIIRSYEVKNCEEAEGFEFVILGGSALNANEDIEFEVQVKQGNGLYSGVLPAGYTIKWTTPNHTEILGYGSTLSVSNDYPHVYVNAVVSNGCTEKIEWKPILRCDTENNLDQIFIVKKNIPCVGFTDGSVTIAIPNPTGAEITALLDGVAELLISSQDNNAIIEVGNLSGVTPHNIQISLGECIFDLNFELGERSTEKIFDRLENDVCYYDESCNDITFGEYQYQQHAEIRWWGSEGGIFEACKTPIYCGDQKVGEKKFEKKWANAREYERALNAALIAALNNGLYPVDYITHLIDYYNNKVGTKICQRVRYCSQNLRFFGKFPIIPGVSREPNDIEFDPVTGCEHVDCKGPWADYSVCSNDEDIYDNPPSLDNCFPRSANIYEIYVNLTKWNQQPNFPGSQLYNFVLENGLRPEAKCANVVYCQSNFDKIYDNMASVMCNLPIFDCGNGVEIGRTCSTGVVFNNAGVVVGETVLCESTFSIGQCKSPNINFIPYKPVVVQGEMEETFVKVNTNSNQNEELINLGIAQSSIANNPKGLLKNNNVQFYENFDPEDEEVLRDSINKMSHFIEDWDYEHTISIEQAELGKESRIIFEDTTVAWINHISADTLFEIKHLSSVGYDIVLGGTFSGALQYDSVTVATSDSLSAFLFRIGYGGELETFHIIENLAPGSQVAFSENRNKAIAIAGKHLGNAEVNDIPIAPNEGFFVVLIDSADQVQLLGDLQGTTDLDVIDVSYSPDSSNAHVALALRGTGALTLNGQTVVNTGTEELTIISLDSINHYNWNIAVPTDSINANKFDMTYGPDNSLFVGMTLNTQIPALPNGGGQDISLLKIDAQGATVWNKLYGTTEDETVSKLLYDHEILYFGGEFTGSVGDKTIGKYVFSNIVPANTKAYISYVIDGEEEQGATERIGNNQVVEQATTQGIEFGDKIEVYPNPFNNKLYIKVTGQKVGRIEIANYLGQTVYRVETGDLNNLEVDFNKNGNGFYFVKVFAENGTLIGTEKVVKQK